MRILRWLAVIVLVVPATVSADDHRADVNFAFSYAKGSNLVGFHTAFALPIPSRPRWSAVADFSFHGDVDSDISEKRITGLLGTRYTAPLPDHRKHKLFAQALVIGWGQARFNGEGDEDFATAFGGGWEFIFKEPATTAAQTVPTSANGIRVQVDYVVAQGDTKNFPRLSVGWVHRWEKK
jgi:hypothetical protein